MRAERSRHSNPALFFLQNWPVRLRSDLAHPSVAHLYFARRPVSSPEMHSQTVYTASVNTDAHLPAAQCIVGLYMLETDDEP